MGSVILASLLSEITVTIYIGRWWHPDPEAELEIGRSQDTRRGAMNKLSGVVIICWLTWNKKKSSFMIHW
ncbi:unnamed protein product, partial [Tenebrio molitor]